MTILRFLKALIARVSPLCTYGRFITFVLSILALLPLLMYFTLNRPPTSFIEPHEIIIPEGTSVRQVGELLYEEGLIRSTLLFRLIARGRYSDGVIQAGTYRLEDGKSTHELLQDLMSGVAIMPLTPITFPEGFTIYDAREYIDGAIQSINIEHALAYEGTLFPDTYFVAPHETFDDLVERMRDEFSEKIEPLTPQIEASGFTQREVVILASILEREANDETSMRMVSGILQNRLRENLPLQVDAVFEYKLGKTSAELTIEDLAMDSPFNTYTHFGLPPAPIANPGLMAIRAVLEPAPSDYLYYLTGTDGNFYYAKTFEEHKRNKARYLR